MSRSNQHDNEDIALFCGGGHGDDQPNPRRQAEGDHHRLPHPAAQLAAQVHAVPSGN
jgi:hypothetical protein